MVNLAPLLLLKDLSSLEWSIFLSNHDTDLLPINLIIIRDVPSLHNFQSFVAPVTAFLKCIIGIKFKMSKYFSKTYEISQSQHLIGCVCTTFNQK